MREAQERKSKPREIKLYRPVDADGSIGDSLSQVRGIPFEESNKLSLTFKSGIVYRRRPNEPYCVLFSF